MTADDRIVALHDYTMARPTGGKVKKPVGEFTLRQIRNMPFKLGRRVETTRRLIQIAGRQGTPIMVTIDSYRRYKDQWDSVGLKALWKAAKKHPKPSSVHFGGAGGEKGAMTMGAPAPGGTADRRCPYDAELLYLANAEFWTAGQLLHTLPVYTCLRCGYKRDCSDP